MVCFKRIFFFTLFHKIWPTVINEDAPVPNHLRQHKTYWVSKLVSAVKSLKFGLGNEVDEVEKDEQKVVGNVLKSLNMDDSTIIEKSK